MSTLPHPPAARQAEDLAARLSAPFDPSEVKFKPAVVSGSRALAMPYIDARCVMDRLDDVLGVDGWQDRYTVLSDGSVMCRLRIRMADSWIVKADVGGQSEQPDEGDRMKAAFSDALKRAAVKFGIGRYLYRLPAQWCDYDPQKRHFVRPPSLPAGPTAKAKAKTATKAKAPDPQTIGTEGARKLNDLAAHKGVILDTYLEVAGVSQFQPLTEVAPEQARQVWRTLLALPDAAATPTATPPAAAPSAPASTSNTLTPSTNGKTTSRISVPF